MKLSIAKEELIKGLQAVQNVVSTRTTLPVLTNILLIAEGKNLQLTGTDLDVTITCQVEGEIEKEGSVTLPAKRFVGIVRELESEEIELESDDRSVCTIKSGSSFYKVNGLPAEEYPAKPKSAEGISVTLPQVNLRRMLKRTSFAVSTDETRYVLNGIYLTMKEQRVTLVATDGRRLALTDEEIELPEEADVQIIVPTKAINELARLLQDEGTVEISCGQNQASFTLGGEDQMAILMVTKLVDGNYPNYKQVIPSETGERITLGREEFLHALRRADIMTSDKANSVKLSFTRNNLSITANTPEVGEARESLAINYKGKEVAIAFNPTYLMDPLKALESDDIYFEINDELSPGVIKISEPFLYVIMPMRTS